MNRSILYTLLLLTLALSANAQVDSNATSETKSLYCYLKSVQGKSLIVGQQFFTYNGQNFTDNDCLLDTSDCLTSTGSHPALLGVNYYKDSTIIKDHILNIYNHGGIATMQWTMNNPVTGGSSNDTTPAVDSILPGGSKYNFYRKVLDTLGNFCKHLVGGNNELIPVIFRPFHECTGNSDWWGADFCTNTQYIALFQSTVSYLRDTLGVHNLLYAYAPAHPADYLPQLYSYRYPGDAFVDIIGFDRYNKDNQNYSNLLLQDCDTVVLFAERRNKVAAITESGVKNGVQNTAINSWFTSQFLNPLLSDTIAKKVAYWLTWTNTSPTSYWVPLPSQPTYQSYDSLYNNPYTLFLKDLPSTIYNGSTCTVVTSLPNTNAVNEPSIKIYPNPANSKLNIDCSEKVKQVDICNVLGEVVITSNKTQISTDGLSSGLYFIKVTGSTFVWNDKFIKN